MVFVLIVESVRVLECRSIITVQELKRRFDGNALTNYGKTPEQVQEMLKAQGSCCAICKTTDPGTKGWVVDHDHECCPGTKSCGECIRGILCSRCNLGLGHFFEPKTVLAAYNYLIIKEIKVLDNTSTL
jgi:hypothetical protein